MATHLKFVFGVTNLLPKSCDNMVIRAEELQSQGLGPEYFRR